MFDIPSLKMLYSFLKYAETKICFLRKERKKLKNIYVQSTYLVLFCTTA